MNKTWKKSIFEQLKNTQIKQDESIKSSNEKIKKSTSFKRSFSESAIGALQSTKSVKLKKTKCEINNTTNWEICFAPTKPEELAVQPKKLEELHNWFRHCEHVKNLKNVPSPICLLTGPSGCGKTASVRLLAHLEQYDIQEWINPLDQEQINNTGDDYAASGSMQSQLEVFKSFLIRASRYKSVLEETHNKKRLLLVEDFPNVLMNDANTFEEILENYVAYGKSPLIFICTDAKTRALNISYNLFNESVQLKFHIEHISFNSIAVTLLTKAMKRFCNIMRSNTDINDLYKLPSADVIDSIVVTAQGDIRNALLNLHFAALKGAPNIKLQRAATEDSLNIKSKTKRKKPATITLKSMGRNESITFLHGIGRVLNPKLDAAGKLTHIAGSVAEIFLAEPQRTLDFLHRNYLPHFSTLEDVAQACDGLTMSDIFYTRNYSERSNTSALALDLAVRSMMMNNRAPKSGWFPVHGPVRYWETEAAKDIESTAKQFVLEQSQTISVPKYAVEYAVWHKIICSTTN